MELNYCSFPDDLLYDLENLVWVRVEGEVAKIGATSILVFLAGKLTRITLRPKDLTYASGQSLGTIESPRFVGALRTPLSGSVLKFNDELVSRPRLLNDSPYGDGWFARIQIAQPAELQKLRGIDSIQEEAKSKISELHVRCFKAIPDFEMHEIGSECVAALAHLNELLPRISKGEIIHLVSDDVTAYVEMVRWTEQTGNRLVDWREEGKISHFLIEKS